MNSKKITVSIGAFLLGITALTGCQGGSGSENVTTETPSETETQLEGQNEETPEGTPDPPIHSLEKTPTGAVHSIEASVTMSPTDIQDLKDIVKLISEEDSMGQPPDPVAFYGEKPGLMLLQENRDKYKVTYLETERGAGLEFVSEDPEIVEALHKWVDNGELPSFGSGDLGVYGPSY